MPIQVPALQTYQTENPLDMYAKALQIRNANQQGQVGAEKLRQDQIKTQMMEQSQQDNQTVTQTLAQTQGNMEKALPMLAGKVSPQTYQTLLDHHVKTQKELNGTPTEQLNALKYKNEQYTGLVQQAASLSPEQYLAAWPSIAEASNKVHPEYQLDPNNPIPQAQLPAMAIGLMTTDEYIKQAQEKRAVANQQLDVQKFAETQKVNNATIQHNQNTEALTRRGQDITVRGQNLTDARAKEANRNTVGVPLEQLPPDQQALVHEIGTGKMAMGNLDRILTKNPGLMAAVAQVYPDFDQSKVKSYMQAQRDFTGAGKIGIQLNAGSTAMRHFAQLKKINEDNPVEVRIHGTAANKAYNNLLDTVAGEVLTFYGTPKTNETLASVKATLGGMTNRNAAIQEQALAMGQKFDEIENTWLNAAPSKSYQGPMPGYSREAMAARASLDPEYAQRIQGQQGTSQQSPPQQQAQPRQPIKAPKVGTIEDGHMFKGGNPAEPNNWKKVK